MHRRWRSWNALDSTNQGAFYQPQPGYSSLEPTFGFGYPGQQPYSTFDPGLTGGADFVSRSGQQQNVATIFDDVSRVDIDCLTCFFGRAPFSIFVENEKVKRKFFAICSLHLAGPLFQYLLIWKGCQKNVKSQHQTQWISLWAALYQTLGNAELIGNGAQFLSQGHEGFSQLFLSLGKMMDKHLVHDS